MSEEYTGEPEEARSSEVVPGDDPGSPVEKPARRRRTRPVLGSILLAAVVLAGGGYTVVTVRDADRDPGAVRWEIPEPVASASGKPAEGSLRALFVPYGTDGLRPGPDIENYGNDTEFNERQATAVRAEQLKGMPRKYRDVVEKRRITRLAIRTYLSRETSHGAGEPSYLVEVGVTRFADRGSVRLTVDAYRGMAASDVFDEGPVIKGHKDAVCVRARDDEDDDELVALECVAGIGDLLVSFSATGSDPTDTEGITTLVAKQLGRIGDAGRAV